VNDDLITLAKVIVLTLEPVEITLILDDSIAECDAFPMPFAKAWAVLVDRGLLDDLTGARTDLGDAVVQVLELMTADASLDDDLFTGPIELAHAELQRAGLDPVVVGQRGAAYVRALLEAQQERDEITNLSAELAAAKQKP